MKKKEIGKCKDCKRYKKLRYLDTTNREICERKDLPYQYLPEIIKGCWHWNEKKK